MPFLYSVPDPRLLCDFWRVPSVAVQAVHILTEVNGGLRMAFLGPKLMASSCNKQLVSWIWLPVYD